MSDLPESNVTLTAKRTSKSKIIACLSEGKATKNCNYKQLSITNTHIEQECQHCGNIRSVMRRRQSSV